MSWGLLAVLLLVVDAPPSLNADAERIRRIDSGRLEHALTSAGLSLPQDVRIALVADDDPRARAIPSWIVGLAAGERDVVIFPERVLSYPYDSLESVVRHEVTHLALNVAAGSRPLPRWFHEGVATSVDSGWDLGARLQLLLAMLARPDLADLTRLFASSSQSDTSSAYLLAAVLVHDVRQRYGAAAPGAIAARVAAGTDFAEAFRIETGVTPEAAAAGAWSSYRRSTAWVPAVTSPSAAWTLFLVLAGAAFVAARRRRTRRRRQWDEEEGALSATAANAGPVMEAPLIVEFVPGSALEREQPRASDLPIHRNGPPGTFVRIGRVRVSLPTDQIVAADDSDGRVLVGFGGMQFTGVEDGQLIFLRVRDLWPEEQLSPARSWKMILEPEWVAGVRVNGRRVWKMGSVVI